MAFLAPEALDLGDRDALHPDLRKRLAYIIELEGFYDGGDHFHCGFSLSPGAPGQMCYMLFDTENTSRSSPSSLLPSMLVPQ